MSREVKEKLARSLTAETTELIPYLPYLLQDFWSLGGSPERIAELIEKYVCLSESTKILDLACGKGAVSIKIAQKLRTKVKGIDIMPAFAEFAARKAKELGVNDFCEFIVADINEAIKTERDYDCLVYVSAGNILGNPAKTLHHLKSTVKTGGYLLIEDAYLSKNSSLENVKFHYEYLTKTQWTTLFEDMGLDLIETVYDHNPSPSPESDMSAISARANELIEKYPDKKAVFEGYILSQQNEYDDLDESLVCVIWMLRNFKNFERCY